MSNNESKEQKKIIDFLKGKGFKVIKIVQATTAGEVDVVASEPPIGRHWEIEVKTETGVVSKLQEIAIRDALRTGAVAFVAFGFKDFLNKYEMYKHGAKK